MDNHLHFGLIKPHASIIDFVEGFWFLENRSATEKEIIVLPDGRVELTLSKSAKEDFHLTLSGIETHPQQALLAPHTKTFAISFKLPAIEYLLHDSIFDVVDYAKRMPEGFWDLEECDLDDFDRFVKKATAKIQSLLPKDPDSRKLQLFHLIYSAEGALSVKELSEKVFWSSRQINRYFNERYGIALKSYCNILRFRASLKDLAEGNFFPDLSFADQSHYIKQVKKFSGVSPKELRKNQNDRFIQFSVLKQK